MKDSPIFFFFLKLLETVNFPMFIKNPAHLEYSKSILARHWKWLSLNTNLTYYYLMGFCVPSLKSKVDDYFIQSVKNGVRSRNEQSWKRFLQTDNNH